MKQKVIELSILSLPNVYKVFQVESNASGNAIGAMLSQDSKPIAFFSENLNDAKINIMYMIKNSMLLFKPWRVGDMI